MVLLIPEAVRKLREEGRVEGREEGRVQGRKEGRVQGREEVRSRLEAVIEDLGDSLPPDVIEKLRERLLNPSSDKRK